MDRYEEAIEHLIGSCETLVDAVNEGHSASDLRQYIAIQLRVALENVEKAKLVAVE